MHNAGICHVFPEKNAGAPTKRDSGRNQLMQECIYPLIAPIMTPLTKYF